MPRAPKPQNLPEGTVWRDKPRLNIPGSVWLPDTGYGKLAAATEDYLRRGLVRATAGNTAALVVVYCQADCWMSWNAAKRILTYGYSNVAWYPEGTDGWERAGLDLTESQPEPRAGEAAPRTRPQKSKTTPCKVEMGGSQHSAACVRGRWSVVTAQLILLTIRFPAESFVRARTDAGRSRSAPRRRI